MNQLLIAGQTDVGQRRKDNQDTFISSPIWSDNSALLAVIDGVGGYAGGDRAAAIARESIERYMAAPNGDPLSMLREAVVFANNQINDQRQQDLKLAQMCCVLTAAVADASAGKLYFVHVGDTRLYRYRQNALEKLTYDHSMVGIREDANELTETEAMQHPRRNEILREVGSTAHRVDDPDFLESGETDFLPGDLLLLCSDGLTDMITQAQIVGVLNRKLSLDSQVDGLIKLANKQGGNDNITVVLAKNNATSTASTPPVAPTPRVRTQEIPAAGPPSTSGPTTSPVAVPPPTPAQQSPVPKTVEPSPPAKRTPVNIWAIVSLILVGILVFEWYQLRQPDSIPASTTADTRPVSTSDSAVVAGAQSPILDSLLRTAYRSADHQLMLTNDTLRLTQPLQLTDSLKSIVGRSRLTVLVPADTTQSQVAVRVIYPGAVNIENLVISGFKTGIETAGPARVRLKDVSFQNVGLPVRAAVRQDTFRNTVMILSVQNQTVPSVPPKPSRN